MKRLLILLAFSVFPFAHLQAQSGSPATDPDGWLLAFLDVETTGLVPGYHKMIDLGLHNVFRITDYGLHIYYNIPPLANVVKF